jgi:glycosyltransferase involved in cell wall biosynthesis
VSDANAGFTVPAEDPHAIVDAILKLKSMSIGERNKMGQNGRRYALENYDYEKLAKRLSDILR